MRTLWPVQFQPEIPEVVGAEGSVSALRIRAYPVSDPRSHLSRYLSSESLLVRYRLSEAVLS